MQDNFNTFLCQYDKASEDGYHICLSFNSIPAAKAAARELLAFLGEDKDIPVPTPAEAPPHKSCEEVPEEADPLTQAQRREIEFSDMLRVYRATHGYSQRKLAELLGTTQSNICHWENGTFVPHAGTQQAIRNKLESGEFNV
jgi:DNA-binding XRE family transcriptional regulator